MPGPFRAAPSLGGPSVVVGALAFAYRQSATALGNGNHDIMAQARSGPHVEKTVRQVVVHSVVLCRQRVSKAESEQEGGNEKKLLSGSRHLSLPDRTEAPLLDIIASYGHTSE